MAARITAIMTLPATTDIDGVGSEPPGLLALLTLFSPAFPIGAFAWSHGLEAAVTERTVRDAETCRDWIELLLTRGSGWNDLVLLGEAHRAAGDASRIAELAELAEALAGSAERRAETMALGAAFTEAALPWQTGGGSGAMAYPVAVGRLTGAAGLPFQAVLLAFAHGFAANLVSAAVRLVPLPQSRAVRVLHALEAPMREAAGRAARSTLDDLGSVAIGSEIAALRHETLRTRLFRS